jgi:plasmid rolling circle replication initiator protein Rep
MKDWEEPYFITLTVKACKAHQLKKYINSLLKTFQKIVEKHRKRYQRGKGLKLVGVKSLESNFNPKTHTYNPHFHIITKQKWMAEVIKNEWIARSKKGYAVHWKKK